VTALLIILTASTLATIGLCLVTLWYAHRWQRSLDALERQAIEMKDWHRRLVDRETALAEREHERQQDFEQWLDGA
jgi:hypothetical protein